MHTDIFVCADHIKKDWKNAMPRVWITIQNESKFQEHAHTVMKKYVTLSNWLITSNKCMKKCYAQNVDYNSERIRVSRPCPYCDVEVHNAIQMNDHIKK